MEKKSSYRVWYHFEPTEIETNAVLVCAINDKDAEFLAHALLRQTGNDDAKIDRVERL